MDMSTRVRAAWTALGAALDGVAVDTPELLEIIQQWHFAVYRDESDSCPECQGSFELWTTLPPACELVLVCNLLGCTYAVDGASRVPAGALVSADRATVRRVFPNAELVGPTVV